MIKHIPEKRKLMLTEAVPSARPELRNSGVMTVLSDLKFIWETHARAPEILHRNKIFIMPKSWNTEPVVPCRKGLS
jgi:hypothetical protein